MGVAGWWPTGSTAVRAVHASVRPISTPDSATTACMPLLQALGGTWCCCHGQPICNPLSTTRSLQHAVLPPAEEEEWQKQAAALRQRIEQFRSKRTESKPAAPVVMKVREVATVPCCFKDLVTSKVQQERSRWQPSLASSRGRSLVSNPMLSALCPCPRLAGWLAATVHVSVARILAFLSSNHGCR